MDAINRSRGWDNEILHSILPMEQLVLSDKWQRKFYLTPVPARGKDKKKEIPQAGCTLAACRSMTSLSC